MFLFLTFQQNPLEKNKTKQENKSCDELLRSLQREGQPLWSNKTILIALNKIAK